MKIKSYSELRALDTFEDRFNYLKLKGKVGRETFGVDRIFNQKFYRSTEWKRIRNKVILRDNGCDLGIPGHEIYSNIIVHHINPITLEDIYNNIDFVLDMDNLISSSFQTHNALHYADDNLLVLENKERSPGDTCPWK